MQESFPKPVDGRALAKLRRSQGIEQKSLAEALGITRGRLYVWETNAELDPIRAARYERELRRLVAEATVGTHQAVVA